MAGLYVHVPFCHSKCDYCGFYSEKMNTDLAKLYVERVEQDFLKLPENHRNCINTIFIGGGNPLALDFNEFKRLIGIFQQRIDQTQIKEWTIEGNPENIDKNKVKLIASLPGARLSIGVQRLKNDQLKILGRKSSVDSIHRAFELALSDMNNLSADFILGVGECSGIADDLKSFINRFELKHISAYFLSIEPGTRFSEKVMRSEMIDPADLGPEEFYQVKSVLEQSGFEHYEISNYAKPGYRCIHNENYWKLDNYFGLGPAAVGTYGCLRTHNVPDLDRWLGNGTPALEQLSQIDKRNEFVMLGLRMLIDGLSISRLERKFGFQTEKFYAELLWQQEQKNLEIQNNRVKFTSKGIAIADSVITSLFI